MDWTWSVSPAPGVGLAGRAVLLPGSPACRLAGLTGGLPCRLAGCLALWLLAAAGGWLVPAGWRPLVPPGVNCHLVPAGCLAGCLPGRPPGCSAAWLAAWLVPGWCRLAAWLASCRVGCLAARLPAWQRRFQRC